MGVGLAELPELLLEDMLLGHANLLLVAWRPGRINSLFSPGYSLLIERFDLLSPLPQLLVIGEIVFQFMHVS